MNYLPSSTLRIRSSLVDLNGGYKRHLEEIDATNEVRRYLGEVMISYPTFEEYVSECSEAAFQPEEKFSARLEELVAMRIVLEAGLPDDDVELDTLIALPAFGLMLEDEDDACIADDTLWDTDFGSYAIRSTARH